jgi:hypothetical protein
LSDKFCLLFRISTSSSISFFYLPSFYCCCCCCHEYSVGEVGVVVFSFSRFRPDFDDVNDITKEEDDDENENENE